MLNAPTGPPIRARRPRLRTVGAGLAAGVGLVALAYAGPAHSAAVLPIEPTAGTFPEGQVTLRWNVDLAGCDPNKTMISVVSVEADGQHVFSTVLPDPPQSGMNAGLVAAAAGDGLRFTFKAVSLKPAGSPSVYRWRAILDCTGPGIPPDPTAVPVQVVGPYSEFRVTRTGSGPGGGTGPGGGGPGATTVPKPKVGAPIGRKRARIKAFLGWAPRNRPLPIPFTAKQIPRPLTPAGGTIRSCARGPRGLLLVFRYAGIPKPRPISWTLDGRRLAAGGGRIGGQNLYQVWLGYRNQPAPNGVYTVSIRLGKKFFGTASVRRAC